jgi:hypothetical protein
MYVKAHPFGYVPIKTKVGDRKDHKFMSHKKTQTVRMPNGQTRVIHHFAIHWAN